MATVASTILDPTLQNADAIEFETSLNHKVVGQPEAARKVTTALQSYMAGLNDPTRPIATFLLLGPTGTDKTRSLRPFMNEEPRAHAREAKRHRLWQPLLPLLPWWRSDCGTCGEGEG